MMRKPQVKWVPTMIRWFFMLLILKNIEGRYIFYLSTYGVWLTKEIIAINMTDIDTQLIIW